MLHEGIGSQDDEEPNHTLEQADRAGLREVEAVHHGTVDVGFDDIRGLEEHGVVADQIVEQAEVALQDSADGEEEEDNQRGLQGRQRDIADPLPGVGAVDLGGFHHGGGHAGDGGEVNHGSVAGGLPEVNQDDDERPGARVLVDLRHFTAEGTDEVGDETVIIVDQVVHQQGNQNVRDEVGEEHDGLRRFLVSLRGNLVQQDGERQLEEVSEDNEGQVVQDRVLQQEAQLARTEQELKVLQPHERTGEDAFVILEVGEGDVRARHGHVGENKEEYDRREAHQDQGPVLGQGPADRGPFVQDPVIDNGFLQDFHSLLFLWTRERETGFKLF